MAQATKKRAVRLFSRKDISKKCIINVLHLFKGKDPMDYPIFTITEMWKNQQVQIMDSEGRLFLIDEVYIQLLP
jgi:hypothetical protein